jgi:hypothetical protein
VDEVDGLTHRMVGALEEILKLELGWMVLPTNSL